MNQPTIFVSTTIPYVNGSPHVGFAWELCVADVLARYHRARGADVFFLTGTDDNSLKNVRAAERDGVPTAAFVRDRGDRFEALSRCLGISHDDFIRTAFDARHAPAVQKLWGRCLASGDVQRRRYRGRYCVGCERFYSDDELEQGGCPDHDEPLEVVEESNHFFRLSRHQGSVQGALEGGSPRITPETYRQESLAWLERGLEDFSISRSRERARGWGVPVPGHAGEVVYVWFDALCNYLSALGYADDGEGYSRFWRKSERRIHVVGKNVTRFHCVYWPAILTSAGLELPTDVVVHGFLTAGGRKIGKSLGNAIDPFALVERYGRDRLRYYLLRHFPLGRDGDFSEERLVQTSNAELSDQLGNLLSRTLALIERHCDGWIPAAAAGDSGLRDAARRASADAGRELEQGASDRGLAAVFRLVEQANAYLSEREPWKIARSLPTLDPAEREAASRVLGDCLGETARALIWIAGLLEPYLPDAPERIARQLGAELPSPYREPTPNAWADWLRESRVCRQGPLFPRLERSPAPERG